VIAPGLLALAISLLSPPAFWLCVIGAALVVLAIFAQNKRTGQNDWLPWRENDSSLTLMEAKWGLAGATLVSVPLLVALSRALSSN